MERRNWYKDVVIFIAMVAVECLYVGLGTLFKAATWKGMSYYVFIFYSFALATLVLLPLLFIFPSTAVLPSFKYPLLCRIFLLGLTGFLCQLLGYKGIAYSSPTLASAIGNLTPAFTFTLAIIFRLEKLALGSSGARAKIIGTIVSISGAMVVVLYKGPAILSASSSTPSLSLQWPLSSAPSDWVIGGILLAAEFLLISIWYIIQTQVMKIYPAELAVVFLYNLCATVISAPVCFMGEKDLSAWRLKPDIALAAILYSGFLGSSLGTCVHTFALRLKGPVYIAIFKPLSIAIAAIMGFIFLHDALHLGSVIGSVIISMGFYAVTWGKRKEETINDETGFTSRFWGASSDSKVPLLQSLKVEDTRIPNCTL